MQRGPIPAKNMVEIIENFPSQIKALASRLSLCNEGPFPLAHDDFLHSNILVDEDNFDVTGINRLGRSMHRSLGAHGIPRFPYSHAGVLRCASNMIGMGSRWMVKYKKSGASEETISKWSGQ